MGEERANCGGDLRRSAFRNRFVQQMFQAIEPQHSDFGRSVAVLDIVSKREDAVDVIVVDVAHHCEIELQFPRPALVSELLETRL